MSRRPEVEDVYRLLPLQEGMLFESLRRPGSGFYVVQLSCLLSGRLAPAALELAWGDTVARHPVLRTSFHWEGMEHPHQVVHRRVESGFRVEDWRGVEPAEEERRFRALLAEDRERGFDLARPPLSRIVLVDLGGGRWRLLWTQHHLILDGWSQPLVLSEVFERYRAAVAGGAPSLPAGPPFRRAVERFLRRDRGAVEAFWRRQLSGVGEAAPLGLPEPPAGPEDGAAIGRHALALSPEETAALSAFARREGLTPGTAVQGAWALALSRWTGAPGGREVLFGVVVSGRPADLPGVERMVGPVIDTVPLRVPVPVDAPVVDWLRALRDRLTAAEEHGPVPLAEVPGWAGLPRDRPLFESVVAFENYPLDPSLAAGVEGVAVSDVRTHERDSVPLALAALPGADGDRGLQLQLGFHRSRFEEGAMRRLLEQVAVALRGLAAAGSGTRGRVGEVPVLPTAERHRVLVEWRDGGAPLGPGISVPAAFRERAAEAPDAPALHMESGGPSRSAWIGYGALARRVARLAAALRAAGAGVGVPVAVLPTTPADAVTAFLAVLEAGAVYVPLEADHPAERLEWTLRWTAEHAFPAAPVPLLLARREAASRLDLPAGMRVVDPAAATSEAGPPAEPVAGPPVPPEAPAYLIYTSGSTGEPHGVTVSRGALAEHVAAIRRTYLLGPEDRVLQAHSLAFDASVAQILAPLTAGACLFPRRGAAWSAPELFDRLARWRLTVVHLPTAYWREVGREVGEDRPVDLPAVRLLLAGGESMPASAAARWRAGLPGARLINSYGPTEAVVTATLGPVDGVPVPPGGSVPVGRPLPGRRALVLDGRGRPVPEGAAGELCLGGLLAWGYAGRPALTAERFVPDPFAGLSGEPGARLHRTGDRTRCLPGGRLQVLGRLDAQVKVRGFRVEPAEAEAALAALPGVAEALVVPRTTDGVTELLGFAVAAAEGVTGASLREALGRRLPPYLVPAHLTIVPAIPRTPTGKVDRRALVSGWEPSGLPAGAAGASEPPRTPLEADVADVWATVLAVPEVGRHDRFFDLGGHSLLAMQVVSRLRQRLGVELPVGELFEHPTVAELARRVEARLGAAREAPPPLRPRAAAKGQPVPASAGQERLWFLDRLEPGSAAYVVPLAVRVRGPLEARSLHRALVLLVARHESLRTTFAERAGRPVQVIAPAGTAAAARLARIDLSRLPEPARRDEARRLAEAEAARPFDLARGSLLRAGLLRLGSSEHHLLLTAHHAVTDEWSLPILVRELAALYRGEELPPLSIQYADWALWQRDWTRTEGFAADLAWWRDRLVGAPEAVDLPADRPRPAARTDRGGRVPVRLRRDPADGLRRVARAGGTTLFTVLLAAVQAWLRRLGTGDDVVVGTPVANRTHPETEGLIGFFINTVAVRTTQAGDPPFADLLARVRRDALDALARQAVPYERVVEAVAPDRSLGRAPLLQTMLALHTVPLPELDLGGLVLEAVPVGGRTAKLDLLLELTDGASGAGLRGGGGEVAGALEYSADLFDRATAERLAGHLVRLLEGVAREPERRLSELPLLSAAELRQVTAEWSGPARRFPDPRPLPERFAARAAERPEAVAVAVGGEAVTYGELRRRAAALAARLRELGVGTESRVGLLADRSMELVVGVLGILEAGGAYVPLDPRYPAERLSYVLDDAAVEVVVTGPGGDRGLGQRTRVPAPSRAEAGAPPPHRSLPPESLAYVIYTSGSTGRPKGVPVSHRAAARLFRATEEAFAPGPDDAWSLFHSPAFDFSVWELWGALAYGGRLEVVPYWASRSPKDLRVLLAARRVTALSQTPSAFRGLGAVAAGARALPDLRWLVFGGERLEPAALEGWLDDPRGRLRAANLYGITETTVHTTFRAMAPEDLAAPWRSPVGRPLPDLAVHLADPVGRPVAAGVPGELLVGGDGLARGYLGRPGLTGERFVPDLFSGRPGARFYRSGDLARWLPSGELEYLGRIDQQVKVRGFRIEPGEVEAALEALEPVGRAVVTARDDLPGGGGLVGYVVTSAASAPDELSPPALRAALGRVLPPHMVPVRFVVLDALPLTPSGKVDRRALPAPGREPGREAGGETSRATPRSELERALAGIWAEVLEVERVGVDESFFDLGGHSLLATRVVSRVRDALGVEVPLRELFARPTVAALAEAVARLAPSREAAIPVRADPEDRPVSPAQERLWFLDRFDPGTAALNIPVALRLAGRLDAGALARGLAETARRHEVLRSSYPDLEGRPVQVVRPPGPVPVPVVDLSGLPPERAARTAEFVAAEEARRPFRVAEGPLLRVLLLTLAARERVLHLTVHHLVADGWSLGLLVREVTALYRERTEGTASGLQELPVQYADYARWLRNRLLRGDLHHQVDHWRRRLEGAPPHLDLPTDRPRPPVQGGRGARVSRSLPAGLSARLRELARSAGASPFMALLAGLGLLLGRWSGQPEVVVGSPVAGRTRRELEGLVGLFLNHLALRLDLAAEDPGGPTFGELLARARTTALDAFEHQEVPFERVLDAVFQDGRHRRELSRTPVFQVYLNVLNFPVERVALPDLVVEPLGAAGGTGRARFDLELYVGEPEGSDGRFDLDLAYDADLFDRWRGEELLEQLEGLLEGVVERPDVPASRVALVTGRAQRVLPDPAAVLSGSWEGPVHGRLDRWAREAPDRVAVAWDGGAVTFGRLARAVETLAGRLAAAGIGRGDRVAVHAHRAPALAAAVLGVLRAGAAFVLLDPAHPPARNALCLARARPRAWLDLTGIPLAEEIAGALDALPDLRLRLGLPPLSAAGPWPGGEAGPPAPSPEVGPDDAAYVAFTSGSTGEPKGVVGLHRSLSHFLPWQERELDLTGEDRFSLLSGLAHDPLHRDLFTPLWVGGAVVVPDGDRLGEPGWLARWMASARVTVAHLTPALGRLLVEAPAGQVTVSEALPGLRAALFVGDVLAGVAVADLRRLAPPVRVINLYGATETQRAVGWREVEARDGGAERSEGIVPLGQDLPDVQLLVLSPGGGLAGIGEVGEIHVRSPHLALGYLDDPRLTAERFVPWGGAAGPSAGAGERVYRTGDLGRYRGDGAVEPRGRADRQVQVRGFRVEPGEVEAALGRHPAVRRAAVVDREGPDGKRLVAYVVPADARAAPDASELRRFLAGRLPAYMVPAAFVALDELPLTPNRKLDRAALPEPPEAAGGAAGSLTGDPTGEMVARLWSEVLGVEELHATADFFDLGGHSLQVTRVLARVRDVFGVELPVRSLFEHPSVGAFARRVEAARRGAEGRGAVPPPLRPTPRGPGDEVPASFSQERLWFLHHLEPESTAYHLRRAVVLSGELDVAALARALDLLVARHEALRTGLPARDGRPVQRVAREARLPLPVADLGPLPPARREVEARRLLELLGRRPFDLARPPLVRVLLVRTGRREHRFGLVLHHVVTDGWSMGVLVRDLADLYREAAGGGAAELPALPVQYADYAAWQRGWLRGEVLERELAWWRRRLDPPPEPLDLPPDLRPPARRSHRAHRVPVTIPAGNAEALRGLARREGATPFMVVLAAFQALLGRRSGSDAPAVGTPVTNRRDPRLEGVVGFFVNTLVLAVRFEDDPPFRRHLSRVREEALAAYAHQELPFERLVEELRPARDRSRTPLFQAMLALQNVPRTRVEPVPGLVVEPLPGEGEAAAFDVAVSLAEEASGEIAGWLALDADRFERTTAVRLAGQLETLLAGAVAEPGRRLSEVPLLAPAERHQLRVEWPLAGGAAPPAGEADRVLFGGFRRVAASRPDAVAVVQAGRTWSYRALDLRARAVAGDLVRALRSRPGGGAAEARVGIALERSPEQVAALFGVLYAGAAYVPVDPELPAGRLREIAARAGLAAVVTGAEGPPTAFPPLPVVRVGGPPCDAAGKPAPLLDPPGESLAYVLFTSGSTGTPKGVMVSHRSVAAFARRAAAKLGLGEDRRRLQLHPLSFDASVADFFPVLGSGGTLVLREAGPIGSLQRLLDLCADHRVELLSLPTALWNELAASGAELPPSVGRVVFGGEAALAERLVRWRRRSGSRVRLHNAYGPTETTVAVTVAELGDAGSALTPSGEVPLGRPDPGHSIHVVDPHGRAVPAGVAGELWIGGTGVARGYLDDPRRTAESFVPDPFPGPPGARAYRTGDLGRWLPDGVLVFHRRADRQVKVRGMRLEPGEVESVLVGVPEVREAAVDLRRGPGGTGVLVAWVVPRGAAAPDPEVLRRRLGERLPPWAVPAAFVVLDELPKSVSGKVDRRALPAPAPEALRHAVAHERVPPKTPLEREIAAVWEEVLETRPVGVTDDFFDLGGHSLLAVRLASRLEERLGYPVPMAWLFEHPTVESLAAVAGRHVGPRPDHGATTMLAHRGARLLVPLRPAPVGGASCPGAGPPLVLVHPAGGTALCYTELARAMGGGRAVWGFQAPGLEGEEEPLERVEDLAERYLAELAAVVGPPGEAGPVHLGGWSFGALVAFEMARRMVGRGGEPGTVVALDAAPGAGPPVEGAAGAESPEEADERWEAELLARALADAMPVAAEELLGLDDAGRMDRLVRLARERGLLQSGFDRRAAERLLRVFTANLRAARDYRPGCFAGRVVLFRATDSRHLPDGDPAAGWRGAVEGGVEVVEVPGDHRSVVHGENVRAVAAALDAVLDARLTRPTTVAG